MPGASDLAIYRPLLPSNTDALRVGRKPNRSPRDKVRIRFRKSGDLRLLSHHDLMRTFERMLRRAALPFHRSARVSSQTTPGLRAVAAPGRRRLRGSRRTGTG